MEQAEIGLIGLGVMGSNLSLNIAEKGNKIAVFNRSPEATRKFYAEAGELQGQLIPCETLEEFVASIRPPRPIIIMIKAGDPVDQQMELLEALPVGRRYHDRCRQRQFPRHDAALRQSQG